VFCMNIAPSAELSPWVRCYHLMEFAAPDFEVSGVALAQHCLLINYGDIVRLHFADEIIVSPWEIRLGGLLNSPWVCQFQRTARLIAVELHPATLHHMTRDSVSMLTNYAANIHDFGFRVDNALMDTLRRPEAGVVGKIAAVETYLRPMFARLPETDSLRPTLRANLEALKRRAYATGGFDYTEAHLRREFVRNFGISPHQYRDITRVKQAFDYLSNPARFSIAQIAQELGFYDAPHFNRTFKRYTAMNPTEYQIQANANPLDVLNHD